MDKKKAGRKTKAEKDLDKSQANNQDVNTDKKIPDKPIKKEKIVKPEIKEPIIEKPIETTQNNYMADNSVKIEEPPVNIIQEEKEPANNFIYTSPLDQPVEHSTTEPYVSDTPISSVEELKFTPPSVNVDDVPVSGTEETTKPAEPQPTVLTNPALNDLPAPEKERAAAFMADMILDGYSFAKTKVGEFLMVSDHKLTQYYEEGVLDPDLTIPFDGEKVSIDHYYSSYNKEIAKIFTVPVEFRSNVRPIMIRIFIQKNIGLSDTQALLGYCVKEAVTTFMYAQNIVHSQKVIMKGLKEQSKLLKERNDELKRQNDIATKANSLEEERNILLREEQLRELRKRKREDEERERADNISPKEQLKTIKVNDVKSSEIQVVEIIPNIDNLVDPEERKANTK